MFQFESIDALFSMGGHGPYVWSAYGVSLAIMVWLALAPLRRQRILLAELRARLQLKSKRGEN